MFQTTNQLWSVIRIVFMWSANQFVLWGPFVPVSHATKLSIKIDVMNLNFTQWLAKRSVMYSHYPRIHIYHRISRVALRKEEGTAPFMQWGGLAVSLNVKAFDLLSATTWLELLLRNQGNSTVINIKTWLKVCLSLYIYMCVSLYIYIYMSLSLYIYVSLSIYIYVSIYICVYIYICIYIYMYIHMCVYVYLYVYIYMHREMLSSTDSCNIPGTIPSSLCRARPEWMPILKLASW